MAEDSVTSSASDSEVRARAVLKVLNEWQTFTSLAGVWEAIMRFVVAIGACVDTLESCGVPVNRTAIVRLLVAELGGVAIDESTARQMSHVFSALDRDDLPKQ